MNENQLITSKPKKILSQELEKNLELSNSEIFNIGKKIKTYKKNINEKYNEIDNYMDKQTEKERKAVEEALKVLEKKIDSVKNDSTYKTKEKEIEYIEEKLNITMEKIYPYYAKAIKKIYTVYTEKNERSKKLLEFHDVLGEAFLTKDERKIMGFIKEQMKTLPEIVSLPMIKN